VNWPEDFMQVFEGSPLKNIAISCLNKRQKVKWLLPVLVLGNAIYALSPQIGGIRSPTTSHTISGHETYFAL
jgi:hypothetical protein